MEKLKEKLVFFWENFLRIKPTFRLFFVLLIICLTLQPLDILSTQLFFQYSGVSVAEEKGPIMRWVILEWGIDNLWIAKSFFIALLVLAGVLTLPSVFKHPQRKGEWILYFTGFAFIACFYLLIVTGNFLSLLLEIDLFAKWNYNIVGFLEQIL